MPGVQVLPVRFSDQCFARALEGGEPANDRIKGLAQVAAPGTNLVQSVDEKGPASPFRMSTETPADEAAGRDIYCVLVPLRLFLESRMAASGHPAGLKRAAQTGIVS